MTYPFDFNVARTHFILVEAKRYDAYDDATSRAPIIKGKLTGGIGHNITDNGFSENVVNLMFQEDLDEACADLDMNLKWWRDLSSDRALAICDLCFNMGIAELLKFDTFLSYMQTGDYGAAINDLKTTAIYKAEPSREALVVGYLS